MKRLFTLTAILSLYLSSHAQAWIEVGTGNQALNANYSIFALMNDAAGHVYAAGGFTDSATYLEGTSYVTMYTDSGWTTLGTDSGTQLNANNSIYALTQDRAGNIYAAGNFTDNNGRQYVAKWNGTNWSEIGIDTMGLNATAPIWALTTDLSGNVYAAGSYTDLVFAYQHYYVAMWNGQWSEPGVDSTGHGGLQADSIIYALAHDRLGNIYAAGAFQDSLGYSYVSKWDGNTWSKLGNDSSQLNANAQINALTTDSVGNVYAAGNFTDSLGYYYIAKWNGSKWIELSDPATNQVNINGFINALALDSVGNVYAGGRLSDTSGNFFFVVVWNGSQILTADNQGSAPLQANDAILAMSSDRFGNIYAAGNFTDNNMYKYVAEFTGNIPNGIQQVRADHLQVYPNPTSGLIYVQADNLQGISSVQIVDALGRSMYEQQNDASSINMQLDISGYSAGVYTLLLRDASGRSTTRRIIKN